MFEYFSRQFGTPGRLIRLNYAIDMRYGVLHDIAGKIIARRADRCQPSAMSTSSGRAMPAAQALRCLAHCDTPTSPINVSGPEILRVRDLAAALGTRLGRDPVHRGRGGANGLAHQHLAGGKIVRPAGGRYRAADRLDRRLGGTGDAQSRQADQIRGTRWTLLSIEIVVRLGPDDAIEGLALSTEAQWNQNEADWRFFLGQGTVYGVRADGGRLVATAALLPYGAGNAWISMVLVTAKWRRRGLATRLVDACLDVAIKQRLTTWLDATPAGARVYGPLGFTPTLQLRRLRLEVFDTRQTSAARAADRLA